MRRKALGIAVLAAVLIAFVACSLYHWEAETQDGDHNHCAMHCSGCCGSMIIDAEEADEQHCQAHSVWALLHTLHKSILLVEIEHPPRA